MSHERNLDLPKSAWPRCARVTWRWWYVCLVSLLFSHSAEAFEWRAGVGSSSNEFFLLKQEMRQRGFRPVSLDVNGEVGTERISSVWIRDGVTNWDLALGFSASEFQAQLTNQSNLGLRVMAVDSYDQFPDERYAAVWVQDGITNSAARHRMTESEYANEFRSFARAGYRPSWISANGAGSNLVFSAVWIKDGKPASARHNISGAEFQLACQGREEDGFRPVSIAGYGSGDQTQFAAAWLLEEQPEWKAFQDQTAQELANTFLRLTNSGFRPATIVAYGRNEHYASLWQKDPLPRVFQIAGQSAPSLTPFDQAITNFMRLRNVSRASLAVARNSHLMLARSYTWAEESLSPTAPTNLFRIASVSKPITAAAILKLVDAGSIELDQRVATILDFTGAVDTRMNDVTIRQLLQHRGGWDREASFDPMFRDFKISKSLGKPLPTTPQRVIDYMKTQKLDFDPGARYAYSNFGYLLLGRVIEAVTGQSYEQYIQEALLHPLGIRDMKLGRSLWDDRLPGEVEYDDPLRRMVPSVMGTKSRVPVQYGGWNLSTMDAHGGWLASAADLARFACAFDSPTASPLLPDRWINQIWAPPASEKTNSTFYGFGWQMRIVDSAGHFNAWHNGSLDGANSLLVRRYDGLNWALLLNRRSEIPGLPDFLNEVDRAIHKVANNITVWPEHDLFSASLDPAHAP